MNAHGAGAGGCPDVDELERFAVDEAPDDERARVDAHVRVCDACAARLDDVRANLRVMTLISGVLRGAGLMPRLGAGEWFVDGFLIEREIGRGGSGVVYEATQFTPPRKVALKLLRTGAGPRDARLFRRESAALARLQHPGIAALYASGVTDRDEHYFAMELVRGVPLTRYVANAGLSLEACLRLFLRVCEAVAYAHGRGVIHRDLKPSNILVRDGRAPEPKVLDFGLARILELENEEAPPATLTEFTSVSGTLPYMSPEQARGDAGAISVQSDVYSLGVVLYEALLGRQPYEVDRANVASSIRTICERAPARPRDVQPGLPRDVETVLLKALEKDPGRRYATVDAFADDIERWLSSRPILARPPSPAYLARKFVRRNRALAAGALGVFLTLGAGLAVATHQAGTIARARDEERLAKIAAQREAAVARDAHEILKSMLGSANPWNIASLDDLPRDLRVVDALDRAAVAVDDESKDPLVRAVVHDVLAHTLVGLVELDRALEHAQRALDIRVRLLGEEHTQTLESVRTLAAVRMWREELDEAESLLRDGLATATLALGEDHPLTLRFLAETGRLAQRRGALTEAEAVYERVIDAHHGSIDPLAPDAIDALRMLGLIRHDLGKYESADALLSESIERAGRARIADHPETIAAMSVLAGVRDRTGRHDDADALRVRVLEYRRSVLGDEHPRTIEAMNNLAVGRYQRGMHAEAESVFRDVLALRVRLLGEDHPGVMIVRNNLAAVCLELGRPAEAEAFARDAAIGARRLLPEGHWQRGVFIKRHGECLSALGRHQEAEAALLEAHALLLGALGPSHDATLKSAAAVSDMYERWGRADDAARWRTSATATE